MLSACKSSLQTIGRFLNSTQGNWRNSLYVECRSCRFGFHDYGTFLFVPGPDGVPVLLPESDAEIIFARRLDKSECLGIISGAVFMELYHAYFEAQMEDLQSCPLQHLTSSKKDERP